MIPILIFAISGIVHVINFGIPHSVVFDEVFYGNFASQYWQGLYFFDLHPPFVKILFAFIGKIFGLDNYIVDWTSIGNSLPENLVYLRIIPTIAGILLPIIIYAICRRFDLSKISSFFVSMLIVFENSLVVQSRFILPDIILHTCGFASILAYQEYTKRIGTSKTTWFFGLSTVLSAIALSIKWTGLTYLFIIIILELVRQYIDFESLKILIKNSLLFTLKYLFIAVIIYLSLFAIHFSVLSTSGTGDVFMTQEFQSTLEGNRANTNIQNKPDFIDKFIELNRIMFTSSSGMTATHPNSSEWYTWPLMIRTIFYWQGPSVFSQANDTYIYLLGNPFIYWLATLSIIITILLSLTKVAFYKKISTDPETFSVLTFLVVGYLANLLPFALIGRVMFLYHYEAALIISIIAIGFLVDSMQPKIKYLLISIILIISIWSFIHWSPLTYGYPISEESLKSLMWLSSWR